MSWIDPDDTPSNPTITERPVFSEIAEDRALTRRKVLQGGAATAAPTFLAGHGFAVAKPGSRGNDDAPGLDRKRLESSLLSFDPVPTGETPDFNGVLIAPGYSVQFLAPWGDPVDPAGPAYVDDGGNTPAQQAEQLGMGHDGMEYFPIEGSSTHGLLAINHEYTVTHQLFPADWYDPDGNVAASRRTPRWTSAARPPVTTCSSGANGTAPRRTAPRTTARPAGPRGVRT